MGCGSNSDGNGNNVFLNCVCSILADIKKKQDQAGTSNNGCVNDFCSNGNNNHDTFPVILTTKNNTLLYGFIDIEDVDCEVTVYFRVNNVNEDTGCVQLELLLPNEDRQITGLGNSCCVPLGEVCRGADLTLEPTGQCIFVDCDCLCTVQCIDPNVVDNGNGVPARRRRRTANTETE